jgi:SpoVK/Ycf46/Vps4 family AAA+-type ATPase
VSVKFGGSASRFATDLDELIRARYPLVYIETSEEPRALQVLKSVAGMEAHNRKGFYVWSRTTGLIKLNGRPQQLAESTKMLTGEGGALEYIANAPTGIFALCDAVEAFAEEGLAVRQVRELAWGISGKDPRTDVPRARQTTIFLVGATRPDSLSLQKEIKTVTLPLPDRDELRSLVLETAQQLTDKREAAVEVLRDRSGGLSLVEKAALQRAASLTVNADKPLIDRLAVGLLGLTESEADNAISKAIIHCQGLVPETVKFVVAEKVSIIQGTEGITYTEPEDPDALGGYAGAQRFLVDAAITMTPEAEAFGVKPNKGALLAGPPGTGKTHTALVAAGKLERPMLTMSMSAIMASGGGILGQAEGTMRKVISMADVIHPILLIDEADRMLTDQGGSQGDSGVSSRIMGELMSWQAKQKGTLVIMASNHPERIDAARFRAGRLNTVLFYDLPNVLERAEILTVHLKRRGRNPESVDLAVVANATPEYSGAEIEALVDEAVLIAFKDGQRSIKTGDLLAASTEIRPLSKLAPGQIDEMRAWAVKNNAKRANTPLPEDLDQAPRRRMPEF